MKKHSTSPLEKYQVNHFSKV